MKEGLIHISFAKIDFTCPHCNKQYSDDNDIYVNRCNKNKNGCARVKCSCKKHFYMTYDFTGSAVSFKQFDKE